MHHARAIPGGSNQHRNEAWFPLFVMNLIACDGMLFEMGRPILGSKRSVRIDSGWHTS